MADWEQDVTPETIEKTLRRRKRILIPEGESIQSMAAADPGGEADQIKTLLTAVVTRDAKAGRWIDLNLSIKATFHTADPEA